MFPSEPLMTAIQRDRERDLERASREHRMLTARLDEPAAAMPVLTATTAGRTSPKTGAGRPGDPACGVA